MAVVAAFPISTQSDNRITSPIPKSLQRIPCLANRKMQRRDLQMTQENRGIGAMSSVDAAADYASRLIEHEAHGADVEDTMRRIEAKYGIGYSTLWSLRYRRPKAVSVDLFTRLRGAYLAACERQLANLQHEIAVERARCGHDVDQDLVEEAEALVAKLKARRMSDVRS
jgi:hypothetical protein